jgi:hypothetical protein
MSRVAWIPAAALAIGGVIVYLDVMKTIAICRSESLTLLQKAGQTLFAWLVPIFGARFVLYLLSEHDFEAIPKRWIPNDTINQFVLMALRVPAERLTSMAKSALEQKIYDSVEGHFSSDDHSDVSASGGDIGGDGGH